MCEIGEVVVGIVLWLGMRGEEGRRKKWEKRFGDNRVACFYACYALSACMRAALAFKGLGAEH